jgi:hypothetical protein
VCAPWLEQFWYDLKKQTARFIKDTKVVAGMGHPGGGRTHISARTLHKFHVLNMTFPDRTQLMRIFGTLISSHLTNFDEDIKPAGDMMTNGTIDVYKKLSLEVRVHFDERTCTRTRTRTRSPMRTFARTRTRTHLTKNVRVRACVRQLFDSCFPRPTSRTVRRWLSTRRPLLKPSQCLRAAGWPAANPDADGDRDSPLQTPST